MQMMGNVGVREDVDGRNVMETAIEEKVWGIASAIDIYNCNPVKIRDADLIRRFGCNDFLEEGKSVVILSQLLENVATGQFPGNQAGKV